MIDPTRGYHREIRFDNGYGASVVSHSMSYGGDKGLFEIAILDSCGNIINDHPFAPHGVIGWLDFENVVDVLNNIRSLPRATSEPDKPILTASFMEACGCKEGQMRGTGHRVHNGGWYNAAGQKIGWGDLEDKDLITLADRMPRNSVLFILGEHDSFWKFVTYNPGIIGDLCETSSDEKAPGLDYLLQKAMIVLINGVVFTVDRYGYSVKDVFPTITEQKMREVVTPLLDNSHNAEQLV